jgi:hypothetical protein
VFTTSQVCELDLIFNFHKVRALYVQIHILLPIIFVMIPAHFVLFVLDLQAYFILDEVLIAGELQETNKKAVLRLVTAQVACQLFYHEYAR